MITRTGRYVGWHDCPVPPTVLKSSIAKAWRAAGGDDAWLQLTTRDGELADFEAALLAANELAIARDLHDPVIGAFGTRAGQGFAVQLIRATDLAAVYAWADDLAGECARRGVTGKLGGAPDRPVPPCLYTSRGPVLTAYLNWTFDHVRLQDDDDRHLGWLVGPASTARIAEAADSWARRSPASIEVRHNLYRVQVNVPDTSAQLARAVQQTGLSGVDFVVDRESTATHVALAFGGTGIFQLIDEEGWSDHVRKLTAALVAVPADTNLGYLRVGNRGVIGHQDSDYRLAFPGGVNMYGVTEHKHLLDRYLPDACGVQVVRTAHLEHARDLSSWHITDLGEGRHLVQADELEPWYVQSMPDPEVLAQAREDFRGAIITRDIVNEQLPPWPTFRI